MQAAAVKRPRNSAIFRAENAQNATKTANSGIATGLYYYGARYLDPRTSRWISADPAMGEYIPQAPINDQAKQYNENLPGIGGIFNYVNFHVYHYAGNNPVKLIDPDGRNSIWKIDKENKTIEIIIPVKFAGEATAANKQLFINAAKELEGTYYIPELSTTDRYTISINVVEVGRNENEHEGIKVNRVEFSWLKRNDNTFPRRTPRVIPWRFMELYRDTRYDLFHTIKHEIGHLLGMRDKYHYFRKDEHGDRYTPPYKGWEHNFMAKSDGYVEGRNFIEAFKYTKINKLVYINE